MSRGTNTVPLITYDLGCATVPKILGRDSVAARKDLLMETVSACDVRINEAIENYASAIAYSKHGGRYITVASVVRFGNSGLNGVNG